MVFKLVSSSRSCRFLEFLNREKCTLNVLENVKTLYLFKIFKLNEHYHLKSPIFNSPLLTHSMPKMYTIRLLLNEIDEKKLTELLLYYKIILLFSVRYVTDYKMFELLFSTSIFS